MNIRNISFSEAVTSGQAFTIAQTIAGSSLIVALSDVILGDVIASITTNVGDSVPGLPFSTDTNASYNTSGSELTTGIFWIPSGIGGATSMTIVSSGSYNVWVYEVTGNGLAVDVASFQDSHSAGQGASTTATGPTLVGTGTQDLYIACMTEGSIVSVNSPWTLDPTDIGQPTSYAFGAAHLIGSGSQTPVFTQTPSGKWSVSAVAFKETGSAGIIDEQQIDAPTGVGNNFVRFRLRGVSAGVPRWTGTPVTVTGTIDAGSISQSIIPNSAITPTGSFYTIEAWANGRIVSSANATINSSVDLSTLL